MDVQKERKSTFLLRLNIGKKRLAACLLHNIDIADIAFEFAKIDLICQLFFLGIQSTNKNMLVHINQT